MPATAMCRMVREWPESLMTQWREPQIGQRRSVSGQGMKISMEWGWSTMRSIETSWERDEFVSDLFDHDC